MTAPLDWWFLARKQVLSANWEFKILPACYLGGTWATLELIYSPTHLFTQIYQHPMCEHRSLWVTNNIFQSFDAVGFWAQLFNFNKLYNLKSFSICHLLPGAHKVNAQEKRTDWHKIDSLWLELLLCWQQFIFYAVVKDLFRWTNWYCHKSCNSSICLLWC